MCHNPTNLHYGISTTTQVDLIFAQFWCKHSRFEELEVKVRTSRRQWLGNCHFCEFNLCGVAELLRT